MADALYVQALEKVATDILTFNLASMVTHSAIPVRRLEWMDVRTVSGISVRYTDERKISPGPATNEREVIGYPCHVLVVTNKELDLQPTPKAVFRLRQELFRHFHRRRPMDTLTFVAGEDPLPTTVSAGPRPPGEYSDSRFHIYGWTVWAWFLEPRDAP